MKNIPCIIIMGFFLGLNTCQCFGQKTFTYAGTIKDISTNKIIPQVSIYVDGDTAAISSSDIGEFSIKVRFGSKVNFRKSGYVWYSIYIAENNAKIIKLNPSQPKGTGNRNGDYDEILVNGKSLPEEEWNDINPNDIKEVGVSIGNGGIVRLTITTK